MFANTSLCVLNFAFPDICIVIAGPVPVPTPFPNFAVSTTHIPSQTIVIIGGGLAENLLTQGTLSQGDNAGLGLGVASGMVMGPDRYLLGSFKVMVGGIFVTRLTSLTGQNGLSPNMIGLSITPSQITVLVLS